MPMQRPGSAKKTLTRRPRSSTLTPGGTGMLRFGIRNSGTHTCSCPLSSDLYRMRVATPSPK
eukprot:4391270-Lingulodinium_polyedra.AAC.1